MQLKAITSPREEKQRLTCSEEIQPTEDMADSNIKTTNGPTEEDAISEASVSKYPNVQKKFNTEEQEQRQAHEKLNDIVNEQIFEDTITSDTPRGKIIYHVHCLIILIRKCY